MGRCRPRGGILRGTGSIVIMSIVEDRQLSDEISSAFRSEFAAIIALKLDARALMTRDMELIRKIVLEIQSWDNISLRKIKLEGVDDDKLARHLELLDQAGMIEALFHSTAAKSVPDLVYIKDLTWAGHDFAESIKNESVWAKIKTSFSTNDLVSLPLSVIKEVGVGLLKEWAKRQVGI
jgi:Hypothetical protein (DUF2513)